MLENDTWVIRGDKQFITLCHLLERPDLLADPALQAANLRNVEVGLLLPGITMNTSPTDFVPIDQFQMMRFNGEHWVLFGPILSP